MSTNQPVTSPFSVVALAGEPLPLTDTRRDFTEAGIGSRSRPPRGTTLARSDLLRWLTANELGHLGQELLGGRAP